VPFDKKFIELPARSANHPKKSDSFFPKTRTWGHLTTPIANCLPNRASDGALYEEMMSCFQVPKTELEQVGIVSSLKAIKILTFLHG
jgi:hypothetical protein